MINFFTAWHHVRFCSMFLACTCKPPTFAEQQLARRHIAGAMIIPSGSSPLKCHLATFQTSPPQGHLGRPRHHPSWQRMDSPIACASCTMHTAYKSNHSATIMLHPHRTDGHTTMAYTMLAQCCAITNKPNSNLANMFSKKIKLYYHPSATKLICEQLHSHTSRKEWIHLLRVLVAVQCPLQTSPITQPWVHYIHTAVHSSYTLQCNVEFLPPTKKFALPMGDTHPIKKIILQPT